MLGKFRRTKEELELVTPHVNMYEKDNNIIIAVEMPGADKGALDVHLDGNQLIIRGKKKKDDVGKEYKQLYQERIPVEYERRFEINTDLNREEINAQYNNGILKVYLVKSEAVQPKKIAIKT